MNLLKKDGFFSRRSKRRQVSRNLYRAAVAQARQPVFYTDYGVPDTVDGRFDMICLHTGLLMERLGQEGEEGRKLSQALFDTMFRDMDRSLRERGVGDLGVPKHIKRMMKGFNGRLHSYARALRAISDSDPSLEEVLIRNLYAGASPHPEEGAAPMTDYVRHCLRVLAETGAVSLIEDGFLRFPVPQGLKEKDDEAGNSAPRMVA